MILFYVRHCQFHSVSVKLRYNCKAFLHLHLIYTFHEKALARNIFKEIVRRHLYQRFSYRCSADTKFFYEFGFVYFISDGDFSNLYPMKNILINLIAQGFYYCHKSILTVPLIQF